MRDPDEDAIIELINLITDLADVDALDKAIPEVGDRLSKMVAARMPDYIELYRMIKASPSKSYAGIAKHIAQQLGTDDDRMA